MGAARALSVAALLLAHSATAQEAPHAERKLVFLGVGQGTTGTHGVYRLFCDNSTAIPSVHWLMSCNDVPDEAYRIQDRLVSLWKLAALCTLKSDSTMRHFLENDRRSLGVKGKDWFGRKNWRSQFEESHRVVRETGCDAQRWIDATKKALEDMVNSGVSGLADTPYPYLLEQIVELYPKDRVRVVVSTRESHQWAQRRVEGHAAVPVCKERVGDAGRLGNVIFCLEQALRAADGADVALGDALVAIKTMEQSTLAEEHDLYVTSTRHYLEKRFERENFIFVDLFDCTINNEKVLTPEEDLEEDPLVRGKMVLAHVEKWVLGHLA